MKSNEFLAEYSNELSLKDEYGQPKRWRKSGRDWFDDKGQKADPNLTMSLNMHAQTQQTTTPQAQAQIEQPGGFWNGVGNALQRTTQGVDRGAFAWGNVADKPTWKRPAYSQAEKAQTTQTTQQPTVQQPVQQPVQGNQSAQQPTAQQPTVQQPVQQPVQGNQPQQKPVQGNQPVQQPAGSNNPAQNINITNKNTNTNASAVAQGVNQATQPKAQTGTAQQNTQTVVAPKTNNVSPVATTNTQQKLTQPAVAQTPNYSNMLGSTHVQGQAPASISYNIPKPSAQQNTQNAPQPATQESVDFSAMLLKKMLK